jgi:hypothetical protein
VELKLGNYSTACDRFQESLVIKQEIGDRVNEAVTLNQLGVIGWRHGRREIGVRLFGMSYLLLMTIGAGDHQQMWTNFLGMCVQLEIDSDERIRELMVEVKAQYASDGGKSWVRQVLLTDR